MSLLCFFTDSHVKGQGFERKLKVIEEMLRICKDRGVDILYNGGDTFDVGQVGDKKILPEVVINKLMALEWPQTVWIQGNHDLHTEGSGLNYIHHPNIRIISEYEMDHHGDYSIAYIPWIDNDKGYYQKALSSLQNEGHPKCRILLGHLNVIGCSLGKHGYCSPNHYYSFGLPDLEATKYDPTRMFFGHIHERKALNEKAMFLGALTQLRFHEDEGKIAGFHLLDTKTNELEFISLDHIASRFYSIQEHELNQYDITRDFVRFKSEFPEKYKHLGDHVKVTYSKVQESVSEEKKVVHLDLTSDQLNIDHLVKNYCKIKELSEPESVFYKLEKEKLSFSLSNTVTGLDFIHSIELKNYGVHKHFKAEFAKGFNTITGSNGSGKTSLVSSLVAALYEKVPKRGNIKKLMGQDSTVEIHLSAHNQDYVIRKQLEGKRLIHSIDDTNYTLVGEFQAAVSPLFGDMNLFTKLVYMDQSNEYDLVDTEESNRLKVMRSLFDLDEFEAKQEVYKKMLKEAKEALSSATRLDQEIESLIQQRESMQLPGNLEFPEEEYKNLKYLIQLHKQLEREYHANILAIKQWEQLVEFERSHDIEALKAADQRTNDLKKELQLISAWDGIGCKSNPLPCVLLRGKQSVPDNKAQLEKELNELESLLTNEWATYKLKKPGTKEPANREAPDQEAYEQMQERLALLEGLKGAQEANQRLLGTAKWLDDQVASKRALRGSQSIPELEEKISALSFLNDLCGKNGLSILILDIIRIELQKILDELIEFAELNIGIHLSTMKSDELDSFQILFENKTKNKIVPVREASGGEIGLAQILFKLAVIVYLNRYFGNYKVLVCDEPTAHLDSSNTEAIIEVIKKLCNEFNQIIVITHDTSVFNHGSHKIWVQ